MIFLLLFQLGATLKPRCAPCGDFWNEYLIGNETMCAKETRVYFFLAKIEAHMHSLATFFTHSLAPGLQLEYPVKVPVTLIRFSVWGESVSQKE